MLLVMSLQINNLLHLYNSTTKFNKIINHDLSKFKHQEVIAGNAFNVYFQDILDCIYCITIQLLHQFYYLHQNNVMQIEQYGISHYVH